MSALGKRNILTGLLVCACLSVSGQAMAQEYLIKVKVPGMKSPINYGLELVNGAYQYIDAPFATSCGEYQEKGAIQNAKYRLDANGDGNPEVVDCLMDVRLEFVGGAYQYKDALYATTCKEYQNQGAGLNANYRVDTNGDGNPEVAGCLMTVQGGGWTCTGYERAVRWSKSSGSTINGYITPSIPSYASQALTRNINYIYSYSSDNDTLSGYINVGSSRFWTAPSDNYNSSSVRVVNSLSTRVYGYLRDTENNDAIRLYFDAEYCFR